MNLFANLAKHGVSVLIGFLLGLGAIALIEPNTPNGKLLLLLTVVILTAILAELLRAVLRRLRPPAAPPAEPAAGKDPAKKDGGD